MRNKIQAPGKQVLHKQVPKAQALQKEKDPRLVAVGGFGQDEITILTIVHVNNFVNRFKRIIVLLYVFIILSSFFSVSSVYG